MTSETTLKRLTAAIATLLILTPATGWPQPFEVDEGDTLESIAIELLVRDGTASPSRRQISSLIEAIMRNPLNDGKIGASGDLILAGDVLDVPAAGAGVPAWQGDLFRADEHPATYASTRRLFGTRFLFERQAEDFVMLDRFTGRKHAAQYDAAADSLRIVDPPFPVYSPQVIREVRRGHVQGGAGYGAQRAGQFQEVKPPTTPVQGMGFGTVGGGWQLQGAGIPTTFRPVFMGR